MSKQEDFHRPEKPFEKTWEIDNEARISKEAEMERKFNRNQITPITQITHNSVRHPAKLSNIPGYTLGLCIVLFNKMQ